MGKIMFDMTSTGRALTRLSLMVMLAGLPLTGCKTISFKNDKTAEIETDDPESVVDVAMDDSKAKAPPKGAPRSGTAYVDPYVSTNGAQVAADTPPQTLPGSEEPANIGGLTTQPTGINANRASIFSSGTIAAPEAAPQGPDGAVLPASAYGPAPGVNATLYSVYGKGNAPTGAPPPPLD